MDKVTNNEILERTGLPSMEDLLIRKNIRWTGHLMRISPDRLPKQVLYSQLSSGHRNRGRPRLRFKDTIKRNLKLRDIMIVSWTSLLNINSLRNKFYELSDLFSSMLVDILFIT